MKGIQFELKWPNRTVTIKVEIDVENTKSG